MKVSNTSSARRIFLRRAATLGGGLAIGSLGQSLDALARTLGQPQGHRDFGAANVPAIVASERMPPRMPFGVQSGDVTLGAGGREARAIVWSRTDREAMGLRAERMSDRIGPTSGAARDQQRGSGNLGRTSQGASFVPLSSRVVVHPGLLAFSVRSDVVQPELAVQPTLCEKELGLNNQVSVREIRSFRVSS